MPDADGITRVDLATTDTIEVKVIKVKGTHKTTYKLWVNGPKGMLLRAYNIEHLVIDLDGDCLAEAVSYHKENNP